MSKQLDIIAMIIKKLVIVSPGLHMLSQNIYIHVWIVSYIVTLDIRLQISGNIWLNTYFCESRTHIVI